ncbi:MAG: hypothetical protein MMC23_009289 [Stictis urceolatum]|nr:hypothetical protein [Stictis urceolata]
MLGRISPEAIRQLQRDFNEPTSTQSAQISVNIDIERYQGMKIATRNRALKFQERDFSRRIEPGDWVVIGELEIRLAKHDYTNDVRSTAVSNCSPHTIVQITNWLEECITTHSNCSRIQTVAAVRDVLPARLLDLRRVTQEGRVRMISSQLLPRDSIYATLSHCWGGGCEKTLTMDSLKDFERGLLVSDLPTTFGDAIYIATKLSINYLWIDALCIVQNSVDDADWKHEASIMGDIYANSYVTLAASTSPNSRGGLVYHRDPLSVWPCRLTATWECFTPGQFVVSASGWACESDMMPLENRAWAFQEWLLSKRLVHFSKDQVRWECYCLAASEVYPTGLDAFDLEFHGTPTKSIVVDLLESSDRRHLLWGRIRQEYSTKSLTQITDRLAAFSGIARMAHKVLRSSEDHYLAGLWKQQLPQELLWERYEDERQPHDPDRYIAPSWSWACLDGPFEDYHYYYDSPKKETHWHVKVLDSRTLPVDDTFGPVQSGSIILLCSLLQVTISPPQDKSSGSGSREFGWHISTVNGDPIYCKCYVSLDHQSPTTSASAISLSLNFIPMKSSFDKEDQRGTEIVGLLLQSSHRRPGQYLRVGLLQIYLHNQPVLISHLERRDHLDTTFYLDIKLHGPGAIEII